MSGQVEQKEKFEAATLPSELLEVALEELKRIEADSEYEVHMGVWYERVEKYLCHVCLAGSIITLYEDGLPAGFDNYYPYQVEEGKIENKLFALDRARQGEIGKMFGHLDMDWAEGEKFNKIHTPYHLNVKDFWNEMQILLSELKSAGY